MISLYINCQLQIELEILYFSKHIAPIEILRAFLMGFGYIYSPSDSRLRYLSLKSPKLRSDGLVWFYGISTILGYLIANPFSTYI